MPKGSQVNIRFEDDDDADLESTARRLGLTKSALVRHLTKQFLEEVKRTGALKMNADWVRNLGKADGRTEWGERKLSVAEDGSKAPSADNPKKTSNYGSARGKAGGDHGP